MEQMANRAQTLVADTVIAGLAFLLAYLLSATHALGLDASGLSPLNLPQLVAIYALLAGFFQRFSGGNCPLGAMFLFPMPWFWPGQPSLRSGSFFLRCL